MSFIPEELLHEMLNRPSGIPIGSMGPLGAMGPLGHISHMGHMNMEGFSHRGGLGLTPIAVRVIQVEDTPTGHRRASSRLYSRRARTQSMPVDLTQLLIPPPPPSPKKSSVKIEDITDQVEEEESVHVGEEKSNDAYHDMDETCETPQTRQSNETHETHHETHETQETHETRDPIPHATATSQNKPNRKEDLRQKTILWEKELKSLRGKTLAEVYTTFTSIYGQ